MTDTIRALEPVFDLASVHEFYQAAPEYWQFADGCAPDLAKAQAFFTDGPPNCDPEASWRLGYFCGDRLSGVAEVSFGFPEPESAYLGLMMFGPWAQGQGHGLRFLRHIEDQLRARGHSDLMLAVILQNKGGEAFWRREGFIHTGKTGTDIVGGSEFTLSRMVKVL